MRATPLLLQLDLVLTAFTASVGLITAVTGLFAMNVQLRPDAEGPGEQGQAGHSYTCAPCIACQLPQL